MPISAYAGLPRSGKSYSAIKNVILPALSEGREVWTNIPLVDELVIEDFGYLPIKFETKDILDNEDFFDDLPNGVLIIIDEVWRLWPSGLKANNARESDKAFLTEHGHRVLNGKCIEIVLITQDLTMLASFARNLVDVTYRTVKLSTIGADKKFRVDIYQGCVTGPNPPERLRIDQQFGSYKEDVYKYYISQTANQDDSHGSEKSTDDRKNILKGQWVKLYLAVIVVCLFIVVAGFKKVKAYYSPAEKTEQVLKVKQLEASTAKIKAMHPKPVKIKPKKFDIIDGGDISIVYNNGVYPSIHYIFRVSKGDQYFDMGAVEFLNYGYQVKPLNNCLVLITLASHKYKAMCDTSESEGLLNFDWKVGESST